MNEKYGILIKKGNVTKNTYTEWGIACCKVPFKAGGKTKELAKRTWYDEHGEDTYIPSSLKFEAYDAEFELAYAGQETASNAFNLGKAFTQIDNFKKWLSGNGDSGAELKIYSPYATIGREGCYLLEISDEDPHVMLKQEKGNKYHENVVTFKVKFRVTDPFTNITLP